jgi:tetratricopeptide (TPR) repeat protein
MQLHELGRLADAERLYRTVLQQNPRHAGALYLLGLVAMATQRMERGADLLARSIRLNPDFPPAHCNLGIALTALNRPQEALVRYDKAIAMQPELADAWYNRGVLLKDLGREQEALESFERTLALRPDDIDALNNRGLILTVQRRFDKALIDFERILAIRPSFAPAECNRGMVFTHQRRPEQALAAFDRAIALQPDFAAAWCNRGDALHELGRIEDAIASYNRSLALQPDLAEAHFGLSLSLLLSGRYPDGFAEQEWRHRRAGARAPRYGKDRLWLGGSALAGRTLLIHPELYLGDMVQFSRYALLAVEQGARVLLAAPTPLCPLMRTLHPDIKVIDETQEVPEFDLHCPLLSLPLAFGTTTASVPAPIPYLRADPGLQAEWKARLGPDGVKIGVCWQGHPARAELDRSFPVTAFALLSAVPGIRLISLQTGAGSEQLNALPPPLTIENFEDTSDNGMRPFTTLAAMISNLDLVITTDTVVAHVAGAMGRPTWVALKAVADWRWGQTADTTPWYPSTRLFRQDRRGDWEGVFAQIMTALWTIGV